ncbi:MULTISPECIES: TPM domain-containing protein [Klebsiella]|uniref:TPM domain-containing protein n=1 Tax=Klebsiella TaxID=570 RepID=UPI00116C31CF|nr:TPM domain-containing protein [Klebsiella pasteurii]MDX7157880.1 TPM domain-containing protein [Klebsiella pasteurii]VUS37198.1 Inner membrane protein YcfZ [Klebsiella pasteurii]VUT15831.1 Inner membrane protein YcfZ [Klebsiella pasteurii]
MVSSKSDIIQRAERFKKQTGIAPFILLTTQETLLQAKKTQLLQSAKRLADENQGFLLLIITTDSRQIELIGDPKAQSRLRDSHAALIIENHTLAYWQNDLWFQGLNTALDVLQAALLQQPTPPLTWYASSDAPYKDDLPGHPLGFLFWVLAFMAFTWCFRFTTRWRYALKFTLAMTVANLFYQAVCLYFSSGGFYLYKIVPLWAIMIGFSTFVATWLWTRKRR